MRQPLSLIPVLFSIGTAFAVNINYTLTSGADTITFSIPQLPTALSGPLDGFAVNPVAVTIDGTTYADGEVRFFTPGNRGGVDNLGGEHP